MYCPPRHSIKENKFTEFLGKLGPRFIAGGDFNAKHPTWGSRLTTTRGRELRKAMTALHCDQLSPGQPTYWPTDRSKTPDVLDFFISKGIARNYTHTESSLDLSSDHTPVKLTLNTEITKKETLPSLHNKNTDWPVFQDRIEYLINLNVPLKNETDIDDATEYLNQLIQDAAWESTPNSGACCTTVNYPNQIKRKITEKRRLRRRWQLSRNPVDKREFNKAARELKKLILEHNNRNFEDYLVNLTNTKSTDYSLWKATK